MSERVLVAGAGGFSGGHLVADLLRQGREVRAVDLKPFDQWYQLFPTAENLQPDLRDEANCKKAARDITHYNLAAPKGVNGRNSDNTLILRLYDWEPSTKLRFGLEQTFRWIHDQMAARQNAV